MPNPQPNSALSDMLEQHYRALFDNPVYGICRVDKLGRLEETNQSLFTMLGYDSADELVASGFTLDSVGDSTERARLFEAQPVECENLYTELDWLRKDGSPIRVRVSGRQVHDDEGGIQGYQLIIENIDNQRALEAQLRGFAHTDALTGLPNYRSFQIALEAEIQRFARTGREFSVLLLDVDDMKEINDVYGHLHGNRALCRTAAIIRQCCRSVDTPARFGGDEFALVLPETGSPDACQLGIRIFNALNGEQEEPKLSVSLGFATYPIDGQSSESLLQAADKALYEMKNGRQLQLFVSGSDKPKDDDRAADKAVVTLPGTVEKIIPPIGPSEPEKAQIAVEGAEELYREILVENTLQDEAGNPVSLKEGAEVEVTIEAESEATTPKKQPEAKESARPTRLANDKKTSYT